jgi:hypothetical protein
MPSGDRRGPMGQGPMTGRALGFCNGYDTPGYTKGFGGGFRFGGGRGGGFGRGFGWGRGRAFYGAYPEYFPYTGPSWGLSKKDELTMLKSEAENLREHQKEIEKRISELEGRKEK